MKGPHPQSHVTHRPRGHVTNQKRYISTFTRPMVSKIWPGVDSGYGGPTKYITWHFNAAVTWQFKNVLFPQPQGLWPPNLTGWLLRLSHHHAQSQTTLLFRGHVTKMLYLHFLMAYGPWHWLGWENINLEIYNSRNPSTTWQIGNVMPNFFSTE